MCSYSGGCRCDKCKLKQSVRTKKYYAERRKRDAVWPRGGPRKSSSCPVHIAVNGGGDFEAVRRVLLEQATVTDSGCWEWPRVDENGYPVARSGPRLHRVVLEAKHGAPLGVQQAHHICANRCCINPDHLQPVTHIENTAEMMQRQSYLARIRELERALASAVPDHPALKTVPVL